MRQKLSYILTVAIALCAWSCSDDAGDYTETPEAGVQVKVPVTVTFGGAWNTDDEASVNYLASQLETMVQHMEEHLGRRFQLEKLKESLISVKNSFFSNILHHYFHYTF